MIIAKEYFNENFSLMERPDLPENRRYTDWKEWAYPIKLLFEKATDFKLMDTFEDQIGIGKLYYNTGYWIIRLEIHDKIYTIDSLEKTVTIDDVFFLEDQ